ncbi:MAG: GMC oxidoreductase [Scytonema sp. PMC 1069.18]|nr:GMC oxidoreductase [Scytonema sp. PMC 1069.18]MEC4887129.1 GMC oxidoreductase [Scytonema sp. PMC 1070.18]
MIFVELVTIAHIPPFSEVTLRTDKDEWDTNEIEGSYQNDRWIFELDDPKYLTGFACKFALNRQIWSNGDNLIIPGIDNERHTFYLNEFGFGLPVSPVIELGQTQVKLFDISRPIPTDREPYDVIVIGSGMAGGVLADQLADSGLDTLVLEAGGVPLETHIANLPRPHFPGEFRKHVWERWYQYQVINYDQPTDGSENDYFGAQAFNLGGRSVFWGGFIPRMSSWELDYWPRQLKWDLEDRYYQRAEDLMGRSTAPVTYYTREIYRLLREQYPEYSHFDAPVAVRQNLTGANTITTGMFSTADLLLESSRTGGPSGSANLTVRTHHQVNRVEPGEPCKVIAQDIISQQEREFTARYVIFACGCLESARLAKRSGIGNDLVGVGATDHPIAFTHFYIPPSSPYYDRFGSVKVVSQPTEPRPGETRIRDPFNVLIELGADFNQGRYLDEDIFRRNLEQRNMLCEIVFLTNTELLLDNQIEFDTSNDFRPITKIRNPGLSPEVEARVREISDNILTSLEAVKLNEGFGNGGVGGVAHEVGSLHMEVRDSNNIEKGTQAELEGVVDSYGKFLDQEFIYVCDLSIFPTSPAANPSLTAVALALRLSDRLVALVRS